MKNNYRPLEWPSDWCLCCTVTAEVTAFSVYITHDAIAVNINQTIVFNAAWTNINNHYNLQTGVFTCPCRGECVVCLPVQG